MSRVFPNNAHLTLPPLPARTSPKKHLLVVARQLKSKRERSVAILQQDKKE